LHLYYLCKKTKLALFRQVLLLRFYEVDKGSIRLGGEDIRNIPYDELLDRIGIVMQNVQVFDDTIEENIRVGKKNANKTEIIDSTIRKNLIKHSKRVEEMIRSTPCKQSKDGIKPIRRQN